MSTLSEGTLTVDGDVLRPGDAGYDDARVVYNKMHDARPALIVRCASEDDVVAALAHAREQGMSVCVRAGGHSVPGFSVVDDALCIDVRRLKDVDIDPEARTARVGAGLTWGEMDAATQAHGLAVTGGRASTTGVAGFTLGSGSGWLERLMGLAPDNVIAMRVVTADGRKVAASQDENPDLFWALRGGGGNFGVVTELTFRLRPVGPLVRGGMRVFPFARAGEVVRAYRGVFADAPDELCGGLTFLSAPPAPFVPPEAVGKPIIGTVILWAGALEDADAGIAPLDALGEPLANIVADMPYAAVQQLLDAGNPYAVHREYMTSGFLKDLDDESIDTFIEAAAGFLSTSTILALLPLGGAYGRVAEDATPLAHRHLKWGYQLLSQWTDPADDAEHRAWTKELHRELQRSGEATSFPNFVADAVPGALSNAYPPRTLERLQDAKRTWDPDNVFCFNHALFA